MTTAVVAATDLPSSEGSSAYQHAIANLNIAQLNRWSGLQVGLSGLQPQQPGAGLNRDRNLRSSVGLQRDRVAGNRLDDAHHSCFFCRAGLLGFSLLRGVAQRHGGAAESYRKEDND